MRALTGHIQILIHYPMYFMLYTVHILQNIPHEPPPPTILETVCVKNFEMRTSIVCIYRVFKYKQEKKSRN